MNEDKEIKDFALKIRQEAISAKEGLLKHYSENQLQQIIDPMVENFLSQIKISLK